MITVGTYGIILSKLKCDEYIFRAIILVDRAAVVHKNPPAFLSKFKEAGHAALKEAFSLSNTC